MRPGNSHNFTLLRVSCFIGVITIVMCDLGYNIKFITTQFEDVKYISMGACYRSVGQGGKNQDTSGPHAVMRSLVCKPCRNIP